MYTPLLSSNVDDNDVVLQDDNTFGDLNDCGVGVGIDDIAILYGTRDRPILKVTSVNTFFTEEEEEENDDVSDNDSISDDVNEGNTGSDDINDGNIADDDDTERVD